MTTHEIRHKDGHLIAHMLEEEAVAWLEAKKKFHDETHKEEEHGNFSPDDYGIAPRKPVEIHMMGNLVETFDTVEQAQDALDAVERFRAAAADAKSPDEAKRAEAVKALESLSTEGAPGWLLAAIARNVHGYKPFQVTHGAALLSEHDDEASAVAAKDAALSEAQAFFANEMERVGREARIRLASEKPKAKPEDREKEAKEIEAKARENLAKITPKEEDFQITRRPPPHGLAIVDRTREAPTAPRRRASTFGAPTTQR